MGQETVFSKIIRREIPAEIVFESDRVLAFKDISPQAPSHIVIIPKKPLKDVLEAKAEDAALLGELILAAADLARSMGISQEGFRLVINTGASAGQTVFHLHMHLLGGRSLAWPPG
jgi:histidine triad (HIT) family protein